MERDTLMARLAGLDTEMEKVRATGVTADNVERLTHLVAEVRTVEARLDILDRTERLTAASQADAAASQARTAAGERRSLAQFVAADGNLAQMRAGGVLTYDRAGDLFTGANYGVAGAIEGVVPAYEPEVMRRLRPGVQLLDLLGFTPISSDQVVYYQQTGYTAAAKSLPRRTGQAPNDDYAAPAKSSLSIVKKTAHVTKTSVYTRTDWDTLADFGQLDAIVRDELVWDVRREVERQLFADTQASDDDLPSLLAGAQTASFAPGADPNEAALNLILGIRHAKTMARLSYLPVTFCAMEPEAIEQVETYRTQIGSFLAGGPFAGPQSSIWGLTIVDSDRLVGRGKTIVGSTLGFSGYLRKSCEVSAGQINDDFVKGAVALKADIRLAAAIKRPEAFVVLSEGAA